MSFVTDGSKTVRKILEKEFGNEKGRFVHDAWHKVNFVSLLSFSSLSFYFVLFLFFPIHS